MSTYIDPIRTMLQQNYPQPNPLWNYSANNQLAADWLIATPTSVWGLTYSEFKQAVAGSGPLALETCTVANGPTQLCQAMDASMTAPGQTPQKLLIGHSDAIVDAMYDVMISANVLLDITTLSPPTGRFLDSIKNALTYLSNKPAGQRPIVRVLVSNPLLNIPPVTVTPFIKDLTSGLDASKGLQVYCYVMSSSWTSWNHSKIVAADGVRAVVGGHNQDNTDYLGVNPVNDVSMRLTGTAARHAQDFATSMWLYGQWYKNNLSKWEQDYVADINSYMSAYRPATASGPSQLQPGVLPATTMYNAAVARFPAAPAGGSVPVLAVGRGADTKSAYLLPKPASYQRLFNEPADEAIVTLIGLAQRTIRMSLQTLQLYTRVSSWNPQVLGAMAEALDRGVIIYVVTSNPGAKAGGTGQYYDADQPSTVNAEVVSVLVDQLGLSEANAEQIVTQRLNVATFRYSADETYPGNVAISNHAKTVIVDDSAFYIGSQNMYTCNLNEFGYIVEDAATAQSYVANYWTPLWNWSKGTATPVLDPDVLTDHQVDAMQFILALPLDTMLNQEWTQLLDQYNAATSATAKSAVQESMTELVTVAGFDTSAAMVLQGLQQPFFTENPPSTEATEEALRFVANVMTTPALMVAFNKVVMTPASSVAAANTAINSFLSSNGYSCTVLQVLAAFAELQTKTQAYWQGTYTTWLTGDGGTTYTGTSAADALVLPALGPSLEVTPTAVKFGGVAIAKPVYNNNQLTWASSDGNVTSASIRFGVVTRPTLNDPYTGLYCYGSVTYPATGSSAYHGTYSLYGHGSSTGSGSGSGSGNSAAYTIAVCVGTLVLAALITGLIVGGLSYAQRRMDWYRRAEEKDSDDEGVSEKLLGSVSSSDRETEADVIELKLLEDRVQTSEDELRQMATDEADMDADQRASMESVGTGLSDSDDALDAVSAPNLAATVTTQETAIDKDVSVLQGIEGSVGKQLSANTQQELQTDDKTETAITGEVGSITDDQKDNRPFENDTDDDAL
jgi:phosphatidylserine/phosphatidylglycerophosphate/cardiolipin synthase-like enzyme